MEELSKQISACRICLDQPLGKPLPHEPRPVCVLSSTANIRIIGQAPGTRVHASGRPFTDPSGDRLRDWMGVSEEQFYDRSKVAITPMGFCFPGLNDKGADLPPRRECAGKWQAAVTDAMPQVRLVLLIGQYAQAFYLRDRNGRKRYSSLTDAVADWRSASRAGTTEEGKIFFPLPHPSWRNNAWIKRHDWFEGELLPELRKQVQAHLG